MGRASDPIDSNWPLLENNKDDRDECIFFKFETLSEAIAPEVKKQLNAEYLHNKASG
jgi:hypothetical protein